MGYTIGEFSTLTHLGIHTLRYYEKENLITPERKANGRRLYGESDVTWIQFIKRLKETGMPIKEIQKYAEFRASGDSTLNERMELLIQHRMKLNMEILKLQEHLDSLDIKIDYYQMELKRQNKI